MENNKEHARYLVGDWAKDEISGYWANVFVAGDLRVSELALREICFPQGLCATIEPTKYVFAGGTEDGVRVGLIQYPPFPEEESKILEKAILVGRKIAEANFQWSYSVITPVKNYYFSRRKK